VIVPHDDDITGEHYHLKKVGVAVTLDEDIKVGQKISYSGNTGLFSLPHLHFAVYQAKSFSK
jgi:murein DD-endopeptidase MepM/ murein hydrolase activator NlpD